ncbi:hypothetical protein H0X09_03560 [Candidatus Saccharibacteria bacterium]|nr:hypothetical protein [Candidatus Saccharibacteria bacterium]
MTKIKKTPEEAEEKLAMQPPETEYVSESYVINLPATNEHLGDPWSLRKYASEVMNREIGDEVQLTSLRIKRPGLTSRGTAKLFSRTPRVRLYVTTKF